jgi:DNA modification methylase
MNLIKGDCLVELKKLKNKSVDFVFLDLPYGQTACDWDKKIDLNLLWIELKRIAKNDRTPFFFTTTTKFGYELIKANEKWFRWDLVWEKNRASGFLNAYRLPMRKHEMVYCFAKKSPAYDVSSHSEFTQCKNIITGDVIPTYGKKHHQGKLHKEPLPTSICPPQDEQPSSWCKFSIDKKQDIEPLNQ